MEKLEHINHLYELLGDAPKTTPRVETQLHQLREHSKHIRVACNYDICNKWLAGLN